MILDHLTSSHNYAKTSKEKEIQVSSLAKCWLIYAQMYAVMYTVYKIAEKEYCSLTNGSLLTCVQIYIQ